jgi:hypothetical protein
MGARVHIGIDAQSRLRRQAERSGDGCQFDAFLFALDVKLANPGLDPRVSSSAVLPTPENTTPSAGMPAARARSISPADTTSAP